MKNAGLERGTQCDFVTDVPRSKLLVPNSCLRQEAPADFVHMRLAWHRIVATRLKWPRPRLNVCQLTCLLVCWYAFIRIYAASGWSINLAEFDPPPDSPNIQQRTPSVDVSFKAIMVLTMIRSDLLDLHLASIDSPSGHVFVLLNYADEVVKRGMLNMISKYEGCGKQNGFCSNPNILELHFLASPNNVGVSGSMNIGIKAMLEYELEYAAFCGDDTRFRPGRLNFARQVVESNNEVCVFLLEGYAAHVVTYDAIKLVGPWDENFWPAYAEDCDIWFRTLLGGCKIFYRGGYKPEGTSIESLLNAFVDHGDIADLSGSSTYKSYPELARLVEKTLDSKRGRFAYLQKKWGGDVCGFYHHILHEWRHNDSIVDAPSARELAERGFTIRFPYNDSSEFPNIRLWLKDDWERDHAISSRAVNKDAAPDKMIWQEEDDMRYGFRGFGV